MRGNQKMRRCTLIVLSLAAIGCGENEADKANRASLGPLLQRTQALTSEIGSAEKSHTNETWASMFDRIDGYVKEKQDIQKSLRGVVPTDKYACIVGVFNRSLTEDINGLQARVAGYRQLFRASSSTDEANRYLKEARSSEYSGSTYIDMARESISQATTAQASATASERAADSISHTAVARADTLRFLTLKLKLLPHYDVPVYSLATDTAHPVLKGSDIKDAVCK
jgi:hypothetical protein